MTSIQSDNIAETSNGSAWAAILAAGVGCGVFGLLVDLAEAFPRVSHLFNFYNPVGDLAGKSSIAVFVWLTAWVVLHTWWKKRNIVSPSRIAAVALVLIILALLATFPPLFSLFAAS